MIVFDPLYGRFDLPWALSELAQIPEVRRLSQVRLLNTLTPSLGVLGELRRYSHTLGVLHLARQTPMHFFSDEEILAFWASVLLHDIGTPPFGHLLEYELKERAAEGWSHEEFIRRMLWRFHIPENSAHQIFGGRTLEAAETLKRFGISIGLVDQIIDRRHPLSKLLFGSIDLDNLDNIARMAWALGIEGGVQASFRIASGLGVDRQGELLLEKEQFYEDVARWSYIRRLVYEIIVFDPPTVAAQAVLSEALRIALDNDLLAIDDWDLYDESLLEKLRHFPQTKPLIVNDYLGRLPVLIFSLHVRRDLRELGFRTRRELSFAIKEAMAGLFPREQLYSYAFCDQGTFEKELSFLDVASGSRWHLGKTSRSTVLYGFVRSREPVNQAKTRATVDLVKQKLGLTDAVSPVARLTPEVMSRNERQIPLPFSSPRY